MEGNSAKNRRGSNSSSDGHGSMHLEDIENFVENQDHIMGNSSEDVLSPLPSSSATSSGGSRHRGTIVSNQSNQLPSSNSSLQNNNSNSSTTPPASVLKKKNNTSANGHISMRNLYTKNNELVDQQQLCAEDEYDIDTIDTGNDHEGVATKNEFRDNALLTNKHKTDINFFNMRQTKSVLDDSLTIRHRLEYFLATSKFGIGLDVTNTVLSTISCLLYVGETYVSDPLMLQMFKDVEIILSAIFSIDYIFRFFAAPKKIAYVLDWMSMVDLVTIIPGVFVNSEGGLVDRSQLDFLSFLTFLKVLRILRILRMQRLLSFTNSEIKRQLYSMGLTILCIVFLAAGLIHLVENIREFWPDDQVLMYKEKNFLDVIYLIVTTITTVGYGDIVPVTTPGRIVIMVMMTTAIVLVPRQTNRLVALMALTSIYGRQSYKYNPSRRHVLVCGAINSGGIEDFFNELFHPDHGNLTLNVVVVAQGLPGMAMQALLSNPKFAYCITYLDGNIISESTLLRAQAHRAEAVFMLCNKFSQHPDEEDASCILRALSIKKFVQLHSGGRDMPTCVQLINPESKKLFLSSTARSVDINVNNQIVCINEVKMNLIAKCCICPGISTIICNLITSSDTEVSGDDAPWLAEYIDGCGYEIYIVALHEVFHGLRFTEAARIVFEEHGILLLGLKLTHRQSKIQHVVLNPGSYVIPCYEDWQVNCFVIAQDQADAEVLTTFEDASHHAAPVSLFNRFTAKNAKVAADDGSGLLDKISSSKVQTQTQEPGSAKQSVGTKLKRNLWGNTKNILKKHIEGEQIVLHELYYTTEEPVPFEDAYVDNLDSVFPADWGGHIVVCGNASNLYHFILPLRSRNLPSAIPIVILNETIPTLQQWQKLCMFEDIYFIQGSGLVTYDLHRARISQAVQAVVLTKSIDTRGDDLYASTEEALVDADTIFSYSVLSSLNPNIRIIGEMVTHSNIAFLVDTEDVGVKVKNDDYHLSPPFAAGIVFTSSMLDTLVCQSYYNEHIITVLHHLVTGGNEHTTAKWNQKMDKLSAKKIEDSQLTQLQIPGRFNGKTYGDLFAHLTSKFMLPLGLRRGMDVNTGVGVKGNKTPYVYTNPTEDTIVYGCDYVFVLVNNAHPVTNDLVDTIVRSSSWVNGKKELSSRMLVPDVQTVEEVADERDDGADGGAGAAIRRISTANQKVKISYGGSNRNIFDKAKASGSAVNIPTTIPGNGTIAAASTSPTNQSVRSLQASMEHSFVDLNSEIAQLLTKVAELEQKVDSKKKTV